MTARTSAMVPEDGARGGRVFAAVVRREIALAMNQKGDVLTPLFFFVIVASLFPLGVGPEMQLLTRMAAGVLWVGALLAAMLSLQRLFAADHADGSLEQMAISGTPLVLIVMAKVLLPENVNVSGTKAITLADIAPGTTLGVTTVRRADGSTVAIDIRPIPPAAALGLSPFDLAPGATMTNAMLEGQAVSASGSELVLNYKTGTVRVQVPPGTPMSQAIPGKRADIQPGETVFIAATIGADDRITAVRVQVSTNGVKPTQ